VPVAQCPPKPNACTHYCTSTVLVPRVLFHCALGRGGDAVAQLAVSLQWLTFLAAQRESASKRRSIIGRLPCYSHGAFNRRAGGLAIRQAMTAPLIGESQICASPSPVVLFQSINGEAKGLFRNSCRDDSMKGNPGQRLMEKTCASWCSCCWANFSQPPGQAQARPDFPSRLHSPQISLGSLRPALSAPVAPCPKPVVGPSNMTAAHMHPRFSA
jgi:hypothetical protein